MSDIKCPFCNQKLEPIGTSGQFQCGTWGCDASFNFIATRDVWKYIDRTRRALDIAVDALGYYASENSWDETNRWTFVENGFEFAKDVLDQITKLTKGGDNE